MRWRVREDHRNRWQNGNSTNKLTSDGSVLHLASAIVPQQGVVIGTRECRTKTGEITALRELLKMLDASGAVVAYALHCNRKFAEAVVEAGADYLFSVKDNTQNFKENITLYVLNEPMESYIKIEKNGGLIETRTAFVTVTLNGSTQRRLEKCRLYRCYSY